MSLSDSFAADPLSPPLEAVLERAPLVDSILQKAGIFDEQLEDSMRSALHKIPLSLLDAVSTPNEPIMAPHVLIRLLSLLLPESGKKILVVGVENGLSLAVLSQLGVSAFSVEKDAVRAQRVRKFLDSKNFSSSLTNVGPTHIGWSEYAPYDGVLVTGIPETIPSALFEQLDSDPTKGGGRLVCLVGDAFTQAVTVFQKKSDLIKRHNFEILQGYVP